MSKYELVGSRNRWRLLKGVAALFTSFFLGCLLAFFVYPASEYSPILWLAAALILVPVLVLAEVVVGFGFNNRVVSKWSGSAKIMFGVFWLSFLYANYSHKKFIELLKKITLYATVCGACPSYFVSQLL